MRALVLLAVAGCVTSIRPRGGEVTTVVTSYTAPTQLGSFSLGETLQREHVVLVFYRGHW